MNMKSEPGTTDRIDENSNVKSESILAKSDNVLLNLIAEVVVEIIVKRQKNGSYRIRKDK
jgi:hypothetical protein